MARTRDEIMAKLLGDDFKDWTGVLRPRRFERIDDGKATTYVWHLESGTQLSMDVGDMLSPFKFQMRVMETCNRAIRKPSNDQLVAMSALICEMVELEAPILTPEGVTESYLRRWLDSEAPCLDTAESVWADKWTKQNLYKLHKRPYYNALQLAGPRWLFTLERFAEWCRISGYNQSQHILGRHLRRMRFEQVRTAKANYWITAEHWDYHWTEPEGDE